MDLLSVLLADLRLESTVFCRIDGQAPWGVAYPGGDRAGFHVVLEGECVLRREGAESLLLEAGDVVVLPRGGAHVLEAGRPRERVPIERVAEGTGLAGRVRVGGDGQRTSYICGSLRFGRHADHPLLTALPPVLHLPGRDGPLLPWMEVHLAAIGCESASDRAGRELIVNRLADVLFVHAVRAHLAALPEGAVGWAGALRDPQIAAALERIHREPERRWTVASLAREVAMSRSHFAARFAERVGQAPLAYLTAWRMYRAREALRETTRPLRRIAEEAGYGSEAAFSLAFKRWAGVAPGAYRRDAARGKRSDRTARDEGARVEPAAA